MRARTWKGIGAVCLLLAALAGTPAPAATRIIYCDARATGANDGSTWENAYKYLQDALAAAGTPTDTVEIRVAQGIYKPHEMSEASRALLEVTDRSEREQTFRLKNHVSLRGSYCGLGETDPNARSTHSKPSVLSGDLAGNDATYEDAQNQTKPRSSLSGLPINISWEGVLDYTSHPSRAENSVNVVTASETDETAVLDGFTITGGYANDLGMTGAGMVCYFASPVIVRCRFADNIAYSDADMVRGAGMAIYAGRPVLQNCEFTNNMAFGDGTVSWGGGLYNTSGYPRIISCHFSHNVVAGSGAIYQGAALYSDEGQITLAGCEFGQNVALYGTGGAIASVTGSSTRPVNSSIRLSDCTLQYNAADDGGAIYNGESSALDVDKCLFLHNSTINYGRGGAIYDEHGGTVSFSRCRFVGNKAQSDGGAVYRRTGERPEPGFDVTNCAFSGNSARRGGAAYYIGQSRPQFVNCTLAANEAYTGGALYLDLSTPTLKNCILWFNKPDQIYPVAPWRLQVTFCDVQGGWAEETNIGADPKFADLLGPDKQAGTEDDNPQLTADSPCIDAGDSTVVSPEMPVDLTGAQRIIGRDIDLGAYEFNGRLDYYVDASAGSDTNSGRNKTSAFATILKAIDSAADGHRVLVLPGVYHQEINFQGKAITLSGLNGAPILEAPGAYAVSFFTAEGSTSVLKNCVIRNSEVGIFVSGSSPTIRNVTLVHNKFGIAAYAGGSPGVDSCILWDNEDGDLFGCTARFSCIEHEAAGEGNISKNPLFADAANGDFHLLSEYGRFVPAYGLWSFDDKTSPCIDAGDPALDASGERTPNGGRIEMGAFGGTPEASLSECPCTEDVTPGGAVIRRSP